MNQQVSPISQMLHTLGLTREDLNKRSDEMRQFLTSRTSPTLRVADRDTTRRSSLSSDPRSSSRCSDSMHSFARSLSRSCSASLREPSPPTTPIKKETSENSASLRHYDSMEVVIERQRRQSRKDKRVKRDRERDAAIQPNLPPPPPTSPSPNTTSHTSLNLDSFMHSRDDRCAPSPDLQRDNACQDMAAPVTPQKRMYYREHTQPNSGLSNRKEEAETPTATRLNHDDMPQTQPVNGRRSARYPIRPSGSTEVSSSQNLVTPRKQRGLVSSRDLNAQNLPPSSPPPSSPISSPSRPVVNLVSSPGPMGPPPEEDEYEKLPYRLPPGPYSPNKPDLSYAALVGQAILSSPEHRLTLQEIYDWITIVYPYYKRGETTWMNSIRHVLSTTVCFRKVPRDRSVGRTLWAIWDEDLECFKGGGFKKHLCKDIVKATQTSSKGKGKARKRSEGDDDSTSDTRKVKKLKKVSDQSQGSTSETSYSAPPPLSHPLFPPSRPTPHHQPYYESCIVQPQPKPFRTAEIIFPPLPSSAYSRFHPRLRETPEDTSSQRSSRVSPSTVHTDLPSDLPPSSDASSMLSLPGLTPNRSSSSPPPSLPLTSEVDMDDYIHMDQTAQREKEFEYMNGRPISTSDGTSEADTSASVDADIDGTNARVFRGTTLGPVQFWGKPPRVAGHNPDVDRVVDERQYRSKIKVRQDSTSTPKLPSLQLASPAPSGGQVATEPLSRPATPPVTRLQTPGPQTPTPSLPKTPPRNGSYHISSLRTPLSHKGLHMSPSASLAHYKSNLDPPPALSYTQDPDGPKGKEIADAGDPTRTPRRRTALLAPVTPKRLYSNADSPFHLPLGAAGVSPFRTPGSRSVFDPHDPSALLDDELNHTAASQDDSPGGLFGKGRESWRLYESPGALGSPGKWFRWW